MSKILLNLGAGDDIRQSPGPGWFVVNHDRRAFRPEINAAWDLNKIPWPWDTGAIRVVVAQSVLEHLDITLVQAMNEIWRIMTVGGQLHIKLPLWDHPRTWMDPTHRRGYEVGILGNFDPDDELWAQGKRYGALPWRVDYEGKATTSLIGRLTKRPASEAR